MANSAGGAAVETNDSVNEEHDSVQHSTASAPGVSDATLLPCKVTVRSLRRDEIPAVCELLLSSWPSIASLGYHYALYDAYPDGWLCATLDDALVGIALFANYPGGCGFGGYRIVKQEYRRAGVGDALRTTRHSFFTDANLGINSVETQVASNLRGGFPIVSFSLLSFCGEPNVAAAGARLAELEAEQENCQPSSRLANITLSEVRLPSEDLLRYDADVNTVRRDRFVTLYTALPENYTVVARRPDGAVVGYGTLHRGFEYYHVAPLYADDENVAELILVTLVARMRNGEKLFYTTPSQNTTASQLAERIALPVMFKTHRMYTRSEAAVPLHKIYGIASLESSFA